MAPPTLPSPRPRRADSPLAPALGLALAAAASTPPMLVDGGLAALFFAAAVAVLVGVPIAVAEHRLPSAPSVAPLARGLAQTVGVVVVAAVAAPIVREMGWAGVAAAAVGWGAGAALPLVASILLAAVVVLAGAIGAAPASSSPPWTLLAPLPATGALPGAALVGLLWAGAGAGPWSAGVPRRPGDRLRPWAGVGMGLLLAVLLAVRAGATYASGAPDPASAGILGLAALAGAWSVTSSGGSRWGRAALGALLTGWLAGPAQGAVPFVLAVVVPGVLAASLAVLASRFDASARLVAALGSAGCAAIALVGADSVPDDVAAAAAAGLVVVGLFWTVAASVTWRVEKA